ncbi:MAG: thioredoxin domain-containing protein [Bacteroidetes bacterium]|nr:thioredoxin domain-containing protein [Bacteroidota bacterium]
MMQHTNRLAKETSPYLLQHAHNPVDWFPWGPEALEKARSEDKPILVSIGYAACHWCHVMERESFEDPETAAFMNEHFVNIKIDREERPDLDHIYMDAVQAIAGNGGWPLNVFLTPEAKPFYGGTYFPPRPVYNRSSWKEVLNGVSATFRERRVEVEQQADNLTRHVATAGLFSVGEGKRGSGGGTIFSQTTLQQIKDQLMTSADRREGGFGGAPKFPQSFSIRYLLHYYHYTGDQDALEQACLSLDKMIMGGIYDQLGGGFARYSTDDRWLVPHFEKMLYDNALLVIVLAEAFQVTGKQLYREAIAATIDFVTRELSNGQGGFYSALDADSEGIEGKYYVWDKAEIEEILGGTAPLFCEIYGVTEEGNWEEKNILTRLDRMLSAEEEGQLAEARRLLLEHRSRRVAPALDDKVLLGWNALMNFACSKAYAALGDERYREMAVSNMAFLRGKMKGEGGLHSYYHSYKEGARYPAFLDDYANFVAALIGLQEVTGEGEYLLEATALTKMVLTHFGDPESRFFFYTHDGQRDVVVRKKEIYDGATPSGNSMMAFNLLYLSVISDEPEWGERASGMASALQRPVVTYPGSFGIWATLFQAFTYTIPEVVITGEQPEKARKEFLSHLIPYRVFQSADRKDTRFPLLRDKPIEKLILIFLCKNYTCQLPVNEVATAIRNLENVYKFRH